MFMQSILNMLLAMTILIMLSRGIIFILKTKSNSEFAQAISLFSSWIIAWVTLNEINNIYPIVSIPTYLYQLEQHGCVTT